MTEEKHKNDEELDCTVTVEDGSYMTCDMIEDESSEDQRCFECHEVEASGQRPALMKAFHKNCKGCHQEKKNGPIMCGQCHVRRLVLVD